MNSKTISHLKLCIYPGSQSLRVKRFSSSWLENLACFQQFSIRKRCSLQNRVLSWQDFPTCNPSAAVFAASPFARWCFIDFLHPGIPRVTWWPRVWVCALVHVILEQPGAAKSFWIGAAMSPALQPPWAAHRNQRAREPHAMVLALKRRFKYIYLYIRRNK